MGSRRPLCRRYPIHNSKCQTDVREISLLPTMTEKKHSANGFDLLNVMQTAELEVSPRTRSVFRSILTQFNR